MSAREHWHAQWRAFRVLLRAAGTTRGLVDFASAYVPCSYAAVFALLHREHNTDRLLFPFGRISTK